MKSAIQFERKHVKDIYEIIAPHFSATRYKPWPVVETFLKSRAIGSLGVDVGCGNGKYLSINPHIYTIGSDITQGLVQICHERKFEVMLTDCCSLPYRPNSMDFSISIAVIHHMSSVDRRLDAIRECLRVLKVGGECLIFVWAFEQEGKRKYDQQDVFVSWKMPKDKFNEQASSGKDKELVSEEDARDVTLNRYYHMFKKGELDDLVIQTGMADIITSGYDRDNWYVIARRK
jgi:SAM-dependent methyltransferase